MRGHSLLLFLSACVAAGTLSSAAVAVPTCDAKFVRTQAQQSVPDYDVGAVDVSRGIVTVLFTARRGHAAFAIAMHASGTQLFCSVMGDGLEPAELAPLSKPVTMWWENTARQRAVAACSEMTPDERIGDLAAALHQAAQAALGHGDRAVSPPWRMALLLGGAWIALAVLMLRGSGLTPQTDMQRCILCGLFAFALLLRWLACSGGPGDLRLNLAPVWSSQEVELRWGPAPIAFFRLLAMGLGDLRDTQILWCNLILSSFLPIVLYRVVVELGVRQRAALVAAFIAAAHPLLIAFSGVLERQSLYLFAAFGSIMALLGYIRSGGASPFVGFVLGTVLAVLSRPEGAHVLIVQLAILLLVPAGRQRRVVLAGTWALLAVLAFAYIHYALEYGSGLTGRAPLTVSGLGPLLSTAVLSADFTPLAWIIVWTLGLILGARRRAAWVALVALFGLHVAWTSTGLYDMFVGYERQVASSRYESILAFPFVIGTALFVETVLQARRWVQLTVVVAFAACTMVTARRPYNTLLRPFTVDYEYRFLKHIALTLPCGSHLYVLQSPVDDIGFIDAPQVGPFVGGKVSWQVWSPSVCDDLRGGLSDSYLYIGSSCAPLVDLPNRPLGSAYAAWLQECASVRARVGGGMATEIDVPGRKMSWHEFREPTVRLGIYSLSASTMCSAGSPHLSAQGH